MNSSHGHIAIIFSSLAFGVMILTSGGAIATSDSQPLWKDAIRHRYAVAKDHPITAEDIGIYAAMIKSVSSQGADELALSLARKSVELVPDSVQLRIILAKLYMNAKHCPLALSHLDYAYDLINPQSLGATDMRHRSVIIRMRNLCSSFVENAAFMSIKGQRSASLIDRPGDDIVPIDKGSLLDRYCDALGPLCAHNGKVDLNKDDRGGTSIWFHVGTISRVRTHDIWTPSIRTNIFRKLDSKPYFGLQGAKIQLDMKRQIGKEKRFDVSFSAQSATAQQGSGKPDLSQEALRAGLDLRHFITNGTSMGTGISQTRIQQNFRHSKRFEASLDVISKITNDLKAEASVIWTRTSRKGASLSSPGRDLKFGISTDLSPVVFAGASLRHRKTVFTRPLAYLRVPHQISRWVLSANMGLYLTKNRTSFIDLHFVRTSSVSHFTPDIFTDDTTIATFQHVFQESNILY